MPETEMCEHVWKGSIGSDEYVVLRCTLCRRSFALTGPMIAEIAQSYQNDRWPEALVSIIRVGEEKVDPLPLPYGPSALHSHQAISVKNLALKMRKAGYCGIAGENMGNGRPSCR